MSYKGSCSLFDVLAVKQPDHSVSALKQPRNSAAPTPLKIISRG